MSSNYVSCFNIINYAIPSYVELPCDEQFLNFSYFLFEILSHILHVCFMTYKT